MRSFLSMEYLAVEDLLDFVLFDRRCHHEQLGVVAVGGVPDVQGLSHPQMDVGE